MGNTFRYRNFPVATKKKRKKTSLHSRKCGFSLKMAPEPEAQTGSETLRDSLCDTGAAERFILFPKRS